jgi:hypothetical protein
MEPTQTVEISSPIIGLLDKVNVRRGDKDIDILPHLDDETVATLRRKGRGFLLRSGVALSLP